MMRSAVLQFYCPLNCTDPDVSRCFFISIAVLLEHVSLINVFDSESGVLTKLLPAPQNVEEQKSDTLLQPKHKTLQTHGFINVLKSIHPHLQGLVNFMGTKIIIFTYVFMQILIKD